MVFLKKKTIILIICSIFVFNLYVFSLKTYNFEQRPFSPSLETTTHPTDLNTTLKITKNALVSHIPIIINNNSDFLKQAQIEFWSGNGTILNPIIIENYVITVTNNEFGIVIKSSTLYFVIRNCLLTATGINSTLVFLHSTKNGIIANNSLINSNSVIDNNNTGISVNYSQNNSIESNNIKNFTNGILLDDTVTTTIFNNTIFQNKNGIYTIWSSNNIFYNNNISYNILMGIYIYLSNNTIIQTNFLTNNTFGIDFYTALNNTCYSNVLTKNTYGTIIDTSQSNEVFNNTFMNSLSYGAFLYSSNNNKIYYNSFINNNLENSTEKQAFDNSYTDNWTNGVVGNYWNTFKAIDANHDGIWDTPYMLDSGSGVKDQFPLVKNRVNFTLLIIRIPNIIIQQETQGNTISWIVKNVYPSNNYTIFINGIKSISSRWISGIPISVSIDNLSLGTYNYTIIISDIFGNNITSKTTLEVVSCGSVLGFNICSDKVNISSFDNFVFPLGIILSIATLGLYLLRKYWIEFILLCVSITAILYHPYRKLDGIEVVNHPYRKKIMDILHEKAEKGITLNNLAEILPISKPTLIWHLEVLKDFSLIMSFKILREIIILAEEYVQLFDPIVKELELMFNKKQNKKLYDFLNNLEIDELFSFNSVFIQTNWNKKTIQRHLKHLVTIDVLIKESTRNKYKINPKYYSSLKDLKI